MSFHANMIFFEKNIFSEKCVLPMFFKIASFTFLYKFGMTCEIKFNHYDLP